MRALRKIVLGETWSLPLGVLALLLAALALRELAPAWWDRAGGWVLLALALVVLSAALAPAHRRR
jgi:hypothetical protein